MSRALTPHEFDEYSNGVLAYDEDNDIALLVGKTAPTDGDTGYSAGCVLVHIDGAAGTSVYVNQGTASSCDFNAVDLTPALKAIVDALTATGAEINAVADLSANGAIIKTKVIPITSAPTGSEQDTDFDLPAKAMLLDVLIDCTAAEATGGTKTMTVGLKASESGGDADGFLAGISVAATGVKRGSVALDGGSAYYDTTTRGLLLRNFVQGAGTDDRGLYNEKPHLSDSVTAKSVVYTAGSNDWVEFRGSIVLVYVEIA